MDDPARRVALEVADGVATVRLDRPRNLNALDAAMLEALVATGRELAERDDVRAVVLTGAGRAFCAGLDVGRFAAMADGDTARTGGGVVAPDARLSVMEVLWGLGLATREAADPLAEARALAATIAGHSRSATRGIKRLVGMAGRVPLAEGLAAEQEEIGALIGSPEQADVVRRHLASRWTGLSADR